MENINTYISEKLVLNKSIQSGISIDKLNIDKDTIHKLQRYNHFTSSTAQNNHFKKMKRLKEEHSSVKKLSRTVLNVDVLYKRWWSAVLLEWDEAILEFGQSLEKFDVPLSELHGWIAHCYKTTNGYNPDLKEINHHYKHYLDLYNIIY